MEPGLEWRQQAVLKLKLIWIFHNHLLKNPDGLIKFSQMRLRFAQPFIDVGDIGMCQSLLLPRTGIVVVLYNDLLRKTSEPC